MTVLFHLNRNQLTEVWVHGAIAFATKDQVLKICGEDLFVYGRSLMKPWQIQAIASAIPSWSSEQIALAMASHNGEAKHLEVLRLSLKNGQDRYWTLKASYPLSGDLQVKPDPYFHPCSGKHAAIIDACMASHWPLESYTETQHPYFLAYQNVITNILGDHWYPRQIAVDGCGLPTIAMHLSDIARCFAHLSIDPETQHLREAMKNYPQLIGGKHRLDTKIIEDSEGKVLAKEGADGLLGLAVCHKDWPEGLGIVIKVAHGWDPKVMGWIAREILKNLGFTLQVSDFPRDQSVSWQANLQL